MGSEKIISPHSPLNLKLSEKELRFVEEYCVDLNHLEAAKRAGYEKSSGLTLLRNPEIEAAISFRLTELTKKSALSAEWVRMQLRTVVERCLQQVPVMEMRMNPETGRNEPQPTGEWKFDSSGANKALEVLAKHLGMLKETVVVTIEMELAQMPKEMLDLRIEMILEERRQLAAALVPPQLEAELVQGADGVYAPLEDEPMEEDHND